MNWRVVIRPEVEQDVAEAAAWYNDRQSGLGEEFIEKILGVWKALEENPLRNPRRHARKNIRWRYPDRFPYRVVYEVDETNRLVIVAAVIHAARHDRHWRNRV